MWELLEALPPPSPPTAPVAPAAQIAPPPTGVGPYQNTWGSSGKT